MRALEVSGVIYSYTSFQLNQVYIELDTPGIVPGIFASRQTFTSF